MKPSVYLETTIIGYLASRPSRDLITAANQQSTREWWDKYRDQFELFVSEAVLEECAAGDAHAAEERNRFLSTIPILDISADARQLAVELMKEVPLPNRAEVDALHIATATVHGVTYLLTWNCNHIANASLMPRIEAVCRTLGFVPPEICTPQQLTEI